MGTNSATYRAPVRRRPTELLAVPMQQLAPRQITWGREATALAAAGLAGFGAAPLLEHPGLGLPSLGLGVLAGLARGTQGVRAAARGRLTDRLVEALCPALGQRAPDRRAVRLSGWRRGWVGVPRRVDLRYASTVDDTDPAWVPGLLAAVNRRLLADYEVARHDRRRCRIRLRWVPPLAQPQEKTAAQIRAERGIVELLGPTAVVTDVEWKGDALAALQVRHEAGTKLAASGYRHRVERVVSTMLPGRWRARWDLEADTVRFEVRPTLPSRVPHPAPVVDDSNLYEIPLAVDEDGDTVAWRLRGTGPHLLVIGKTGQGKTVLMNGVVEEVAYRGWPVWICDPKRIEFLGMRGWPNVQVVATTAPHQVVVINQAWAEMERRYALIEAFEAVEDDFEPLIVVLDEYRDFYSLVTEWYSSIKITGMATRCPVFERVGSIVRKGRSARVHLILGTQRPDAEILGGEMRDNFGTRISLGPLSPQGAMMMWENPNLGVSLPRNVAGRATAISDDARPVEVQAYWTPDPRRAAYSADPQDLHLLDQLRPPRAKHGPLRVQLDQELLESVDDKGRTREWAAVLAGELVPVDLEQATAELHPAPNPAVRVTLTPAALQGPQEPAAALQQPRASVAAPRLALVPCDSARTADVDESDDVDDLTPDGAVEPVSEREDPFGTPEEVPASNVVPGDLLLVEESPATWALVEAAEPDVTAEDLLCIDWRGDDDDAGSMVVPERTWLTVRRWADDGPGGDRPGRTQQDWPWGG